MIVSFDKNFLFTHIPKTAGTSLSSVLSKYREKKSDVIYSKIKNNIYRNKLLGFDSLFKPNYREFNYHNYTHLTIASVQEILPGKIFDNFFKFAVVRHPVDWQYSMYRHILNKHRDSQYRHIYEPVFKYESFYEYIRWRLDTDFIAPQIFQLVDTSGNIAVDKVYRFESLYSAFDDICKRLNIKARLPYKNLGKSSREGIDNKTSLIILDKFQIDFEAFGYLEKSIDDDWDFITHQYTGLIESLKTLKINHPSFSLWSKASNE